MGQTEGTMMIKALVPLADGCEEMEAVILIDAFRRAKWHVTVAGLKPGLVIASRGVKIQPDIVWDDVDIASHDLLVLPGGGPGTQNLMADHRVLDAIRAFVSKGKVVGAICAAPLVLQKAGVIDGKRMTCYPGVAPEITRAQHVDEIVVRDGQILTSQGPGTSFQFALAIIRHVAGESLAREVGSGMLVR